MVNFILRVILFVLGSWFLVHILAVFGIFSAVVYPLWWLLGLVRIYCFWCPIKKTKKCVFSHSLATGGLLLFFSLISIGLVFLEGQLLLKLGFPPIPKTVLFNIPPKGEYRLGEIFPMPIEIAGAKRPINAIQADLSFDPRRVEVVEVSTKDSFANIFIQKEVNNEIGYARLTGGLPNPGFFSDRGLFGTVYFKGKIPGIVKVEFLPSSLILANNGKGTNVLKELSSASYLILPEKLTLEEEKQQEVILRPVVLGEQSGGGLSTESTQMIFYEENKILGTKVGEKILEEAKFSLYKSFLTVLEKVDQFILGIWTKVLKK